VWRSKAAVRERRARAHRNSGLHRLPAALCALQRDSR